MKKKGISFRERFRNFAEQTFAFTKAKLNINSVNKKMI